MGGGPLKERRGAATRVSRRALVLGSLAAGATALLAACTPAAPPASKPADSGAAAKPAATTAPGAPAATAGVCAARHPAPLPLAVCVTPSLDRGAGCPGAGGAAAARRCRRHAQE